MIASIPTHSVPLRREAASPTGSMPLRIGHVTLRTNLLLCPIARYCDLSFRLVVRETGGLGMACTDLLSPHGLLRENDHSMRLAATCAEDQPLCMQLYGTDAALMAEGARWAEAHGAVVIDINMGCPADKVVKRNGGVALMRDPAGAARIAEAVVRAVEVPVTVKMRLGCDEECLSSPLLARMVEEAGVAAVTVHGRTGAQRFSGTCNRQGIRDVVRAVSRIPVIGNGDILSPHDAASMLEETGCAGVMIGRRALSDPWIFRDTHAFLLTGRIPAPPSILQRVELVIRHFENLRRFRDDRSACNEMRQRISWYARMLPQTKQLKRDMNRIASPVEFETAIGSYLERLEHANIDPLHGGPMASTGSFQGHGRYAARPTAGANGDGVV